MIDQLKQMAMQKLAEKMSGNSLGASETQAAASDGANAFMDTIKEKISGGNLDQVKDLFANNENATESNGIFQELQSKMTQILQDKGMSPEEAQAEAQNTTPDIVNGLKEKFNSEAQEDKAFDLGAITSLLGGNTGDILNKVKNLF